MATCDIFFICGEYLADDIFGICPCVFFLICRHTERFDRFPKILPIFFRHIRIIRSSCVLANSLIKKSQQLLAPAVLLRPTMSCVSLTRSRSQSRVSAWIRVPALRFQHRAPCAENTVSVTSLLVTLISKYVEQNRDSLLERGL